MRYNFNSLKGAFLNFDVYRRQINIKNTNRVFILGAAVIFVSHTLFSGGIRYDGIEELLNMILNDGFFISEYSRLFSHFLYQIPAGLFIKIPLFPFHILEKIFSFGLIWIHIISLLGCYFILPSHKKNLMFFPLFSFFTGSGIALSVSVSSSPSVCSYVWLSAFIIHYSNLSEKIQKVFFVVTPLFLILSYELMSYMSWALIFISLCKTKKETNSFNKKLIKFVVLFLFVTSLVQISMIYLHPYLTTSNSLSESLTKDLRPIRFLTDPELNFSLILSVWALLLLLYIIYENRINPGKSRRIYFIFLFAFYLFLIISFLQTIKSFMPEFSIRFYPPLVLPWSLLAWWIYEKKKIKIERVSFLLTCIFLCLNLVFHRVSEDYKFHKYQMRLSEYLENCAGIVSWEQIHSNINIPKLEVFYETYFYPKSKTVKAVIGPSFSSCMEECGDVSFECQKQCKEHSKEAYSLTLFNLNETPFFDMSEILANVSKGISECKK